MKAYELLQNHELLGVILADKVKQLDEFTISIDGRLVQYEYAVEVTEIN